MKIPNQLAGVRRTASVLAAELAGAVQPAASIYVDGLYYCEGYINVFNGNIVCLPAGSYFPFVYGRPQSF